jgi:hypothetical protein
LYLIQGQKRALLRKACSKRASRVRTTKRQHNPRAEAQEKKKEQKTESTREKETTRNLFPKWSVAAISLYDTPRLLTPESEPEGVLVGGAGALYHDSPSCQPRAQKAAEQERTHLVGAEDGVKVAEGPVRRCIRATWACWWARASAEPAARRSAAEKRAVASFMLLLLLSAVGGCCGCCGTAAGRRTKGACQRE